MTNPVTKLIEECAELQKALCKAERFGWYNHHPRFPERRNIDHIREEIQDVLDAIAALHEDVPQLWDEDVE